MGIRRRLRSCLSSFAIAIRVSVISHKAVAETFAGGILGGSSNSRPQPIQNGASVCTSRKLPRRLCTYSERTATSFAEGTGQHKAQESMESWQDFCWQIRSARRRVADKLDSLYAYEIPTIPGEQGRLKDYLRNPPFLTRYGPTYKTTQANPEHFTDIGADKREMSPIALLRQKEPSEAAGVREDVEGSTVVLERGDYASPTDLLALESLSEN
ncbi:hypothetical protein BESB_030120 [Besnoitia besnoiti]|uniref:Uncharacterized protein n=1 Tax=Besnoitia besnoiti TaxID=94643 RepID=A0A2A9LXC5_BESBE|nr:hypothetical protein BESB_030120 [Besnoitia besnoiti]PFH31138.1 hypothetical protein BESB_030120 [Besnoitia besnoiti]